MRPARWLAFVLASAATACRPTTSVIVPPPVTSKATPSVATPVASTVDDLGSIVAALVPMYPGGAWIAVEDIGPAIDACEAAGWPATLPTDRAKAVAEQGIGARLQVVHTGGVTIVTVEGIDCTPGGDIEGPVASLGLHEAAPAGPPDPRVPEGLRDRIEGRPHLAVVGAKVSAGARLVEPTVIDVATAPRLRDALVRYATDFADARRKFCLEHGPSEQMPSEAMTAKAIPDAVRTATAHRIRSGDASLTFAVLDDPDVVFGCEGQDELVGVLLDDAGEVMHEIDSNNVIDVQWVMDLDGDGTQEALVDVHWMEDGRHHIDLLRHQENGWDHVALWRADTP